MPLRGSLLSSSTLADEELKKAENIAAVLKLTKEEQIALRVEQMRRENAEKEEQDRIDWDNQKDF